MGSIRNWLSAAAAVLALCATGASAQSITHAAYLDLDNNATTGCSVTTAAGAVTGIEARLSAIVTGQPPIVSAVTRENCIGAGFGAPQNQAAGYPVGLNIGTGGSDVVEWNTALAGLGNGGPARIVFVSASATGADMAVANGVILQGTTATGFSVPVVVPATGLLALLVLVGFVLWLARSHPGFGSSIALLLLLGAGVVWAANFVSDGAISDWIGVAPRATDPALDSTSGESTIDLVAVFAETEAGSLFLRADVRNAENAPPVAVAQAVTVAEDGNVTITLTGSDPEAAALTFAIATPPTLGTLSAITPINATSASVTFTGTLDQNGADSFTFTVSDGTSTSTPATVSITITPVNDAPVVAAQALAVVENSPNGTVVGTATATDVDTGQTRVWSITAGNALGAFAIDPATGQITVADSTDVTPGNSPFALTVQATDNGAPPLSGSNTITITVTGVNDEPTFTPGPNQNVSEDDVAQSLPNWATAISAGPPDEAAQTLAFTASNDNNALFSVQPAVSPTGTLTYTLAPNANGSANVSVFLMDNGGTVGGGDDTSATSVFTITVAPVNDTPSFALPANPNQTVLQDSGTTTVPGFATAISAGPADESAQVLTFTVLNDNNALFATQPAIAANGTLTFTPASGQVGIANISVTLADNGGGADTSAAQTFTINVSIVNQPPTFTPPADPAAVLEDAGLQTVPNFVTGIDDGDPSVTQTVSFNITGNTNPTLLAANPTIASDGTLMFTPAVDANGTTTITFEAQDNGGTTIPGSDDTSAPDTFVITVSPINDAPSFSVPAAAPNSAENAGAQIVNAFATGILAGPTADEAGQTLTFTAMVTAADPTLTFSTAPAIDASGVLTYTAAANAFGTATISVTLADNGGNTPPNVDTSAAQTFTITVTGINSPPSFTLAGNPAASNEDAGAQTVNAFATAISAGPNESGQTLNFIVTSTGSSGTLTFSGAPAIDPVSGNLTYTATGDTNGTASFDVVLQDDGGGANTSPAQSFTITVNAVNDVPSFTLPASPNRNVPQDSGAATFAGYATAISRGPADEIAQTLTFTVAVTSNPTLFSVAPDIDETTGTLTFTPAAGQVGTANISVTLADNGGGTDTSAAQTFTITVDDVNEQPVPTATPPAATLAENTAVGTAVSTVAPNDPDVGQTHTYAFFSGNTGNAFAIDGAGNITVAGALNFEALASYTLVVRATDNGSPVLSGDVTIVVTITDVNEAPVITASGTRAYTEGDGAVTLNNAVTVTDVDAGEGLASATVQITGNYANGQDLLAMAPSGGITASFVAGTGTLTLTGAGTPAQYQTALQSVTFENTSNAPSTAQRTVSWTVNDGALASNVATTTIDVTTTNSAPVVTTSGGSTAYAENGPAVAVDGALTATDVDSTNAVSAVVQITGGLQSAEDALAFVNTPNITGAYFPATGDLQLSGSDTVANYQAALRSVTYLNSSDAPNTGARTISFSIVDDGTPGLASNVATKTVTVAAANDAPVVTLSGSTPAFTEGGAPVVVDGGVAVTDVDDTNIESGTVTITNAVAGDVLTGASGGGVTVTGSGTTTLTLSGSASLAAYNAVLQGVTFSSPGENPDPTARVVRFVVNDGDVNSNNADKTVSVNAVNDAPVNSVPVTPAVDEDTALTFTGATVIAVSDVDVAAGSMTVTLTATNGTIDADNTGGATIGGDGTALVTLNGTLVQINATLDGTIFNPTLNFFGNASLTVLTSDNGNTGSGGAQTDSDVIAITVNPVNDAPVVANPPSASVHTNIAIDQPDDATNDLIGTARGITDIDSAGPFIIAPASIGTFATVGGGSITITADGHYHFNPQLHDTGPDSFVYQICDSEAVPGCTNVTLSLTIAGLDIVFVNDDAAVGGDGTLERPLQTVTGGVAALGGAVNVFVFSGNYAGSVTLPNGVRVFGQGSTAANFEALYTIVSMPPLSIARPVLSQASPVLTSGGVGVTLGQNNSLRGLTLGANTSDALLGNNFGTLTVSDNVVINNTSDRALNLTAGTAAATFAGVTSTNSGTTGITLTGVAGSLVLGGTTISGSTTQGILVGTTTATVDFGNTSVTGGTDGISLQNNPTGTFNFTTIARSGGGSGLLHSLNGGDIAAGTTTISGTSGLGIDITGHLTPNTIAFGATSVVKAAAGGAINLGGAAVGAGNTGTVTFAELSGSTTGGAFLVGTNNTGMVTTSAASTTAISATGGPALNITAVAPTTNPVNLNLGMVSATTSPTQGINLVRLTGTVSASGGAITTSTGTDIVIDGGAANVTYSGTITDDIGQLVSVTNTTGGTDDFNGNISDGGDGDGNGISLTNNSGATIRFDGGLTLATGANPAFVATGGGTIAVTDPAGATNNTILTTSGTPLNVTSTSFHADGLTWERIASNGASNGIRIDTTGPAGFFTVTGSGSDDSGGIILNSTQDGVFLNSTRNITLREMVINNSGQSQIDASTVVGLTLTGLETDDSVQDGILGSMITNLTISGSVFSRGGDNAGFANVDGIFITNLRGTSSVTNTTFSNSNTVQMSVLNNTATVAAPAESTDVLTVSGTTWNNHTGPFAGDHLSVSADTGGNFKLIVDSSVGINTFTTGGIGVQATSAGSGTMKALVTGVNALGPMTAGVVIGATASGNTKFDIFENKPSNGTGFTGMGSLSIAVTCVTSGTCNGFIRDNRIVHTAGAGVDAFHVILQGNGTINAEVMQNVVSGNFQRGFYSESSVGTGANARVNLKFNNNSLTGTAGAAAGALQGVNLQTGNSGGGPDNKMCLDMFSNSVTMVDTTAYRLRNEVTAGNCAGCVFQLKNYAGGGTDTAAISTWITGAPNNNSFSTASGVPISIGTNNPYTNAGASCPAPSI